ncbi:hypothetical protein 4 [Beihai tombus-like virus 12]|uniref:hypothetical protein 4 n=1 Tax=Beihai tombus-like virus 12 TaxID=1922715 RepID=UPI00090A52EF|nr:hypothetical protein 4 [Beihai tombus-like virus 12]APG76140.1 hypothetical protein 4 [Beihai tombus-like virus 12]
MAGRRGRQRGATRRRGNALASAQRVLHRTSIPFDVADATGASCTKIVLDPSAYTKDRASAMASIFQKYAVRSVAVDFTPSVGFNESSGQWGVGYMADESNQGQGLPSTTADVVAMARQGCGTLSPVRSKLHWAVPRRSLRNITEGYTPGGAEQPGAVFVGVAAAASVAQPGVWTLDILYEFWGPRPPFEKAVLPTEITSGGGYGITFGDGSDWPYGYHPPDALWRNLWRARDSCSLTTVTSFYAHTSAGVFLLEGPGKIEQLEGLGTVEVINAFMDTHSLLGVSLFGTNAMKQIPIPAVRQAVSVQPEFRVRVINEVDDPVPTQETVDPLPVEVTNVPLPVAETVDPLPVEVTNVPLPVAETVDPLPVEVTNVPLPVAETVDPLPVEVTNVPLPVAETVDPLPVDVTNTPLPVAEVVDPLPVKVTNTPLPVAEAQLPLPVNETNLPLPVDDGGGGFFMNLATGVITAVVKQAGRTYTRDSKETPAGYVRLKCSYPVGGAVDGQVYGSVNIPAYPTAEAGLTHFGRLDAGYDYASELFWKRFANMTVGLPNDHWYKAVSSEPPPFGGAGGMYIYITDTRKPAGLFAGNHITARCRWTSAEWFEVHCWHNVDSDASWSKDVHCFLLHKPLYDSELDDVYDTYQDHRVRTHPV